MGMRVTKRKMGIALGMVAGLAATGCADGPSKKIVDRRIERSPVPVRPQPPIPAPLTRAQSLRNAMLIGHNAARAVVGVPALSWSPALARDAETYAARLAATRRFAHAQQSGDTAQGENLWMGTRGAFRPDQMVGHWVAEKRVFRRGPSPRCSTTGRFEDVGHYTQIIWRGTTQVGCAVVANRAEEYLVCRYWPAGNVDGIDPLGS
jgi:hypothetical protein